jgi:hypothetical protein
MLFLKITQCIFTTNMWPHITSLNCGFFVGVFLGVNGDPWYRG